MQNQPIPVSTANTMLQDYLNYLKKLGVDPSTQSQSISFTGKELMLWLNGIMPRADELRICLGVYPPDHVNAGRITAILWPYKDGQPVKEPVLEGKDDDTKETPPYNSGTLNP